MCLWHVLRFGHGIALSFFKPYVNSNTGLPVEGLCHILCQLDVNFLADQVVRDRVLVEPVIDQVVAAAFGESRTNGFLARAGTIAVP